MFYYIPDSNSPSAQQDMDRTICGYSFSREDEGPCPFFKGMTNPVSGLWFKLLLMLLCWRTNMWICCIACTVHKCEMWDFNVFSKQRTVMRVFMSLCSPMNVYFV